MKRLSKKQEADHRDLVTRLQGAHQDLDAAIEKYNKVIVQAFDEILRPAAEAMNEVVGDVNGFIETIHDDQQALFDERSEAWQEGEVGSAYADWMAEWEASADEVDVEAPEELEAPDVDFEWFDSLPLEPG